MNSVVEIPEFAGILKAFQNKPSDYMGQALVDVLDPNNTETVPFNFIEVMSTIYHALVNENFKEVVVVRNEASTPVHRAIFLPKQVNHRAGQNVRFQRNKLHELTNRNFSWESWFQISVIPENDRFPMYKADSHTAQSGMMAPDVGKLM